MHRTLLAGILTLTLSILSASAEEASPSDATLNLKELYRLALKQSETIVISRESVREAEALFRQAFADILPVVSYGRRAAFEDRSKTIQSGFFEVSKSNFNGYRELAAMRAKSADAAASRHDDRRVKQLLLQDIATAFYGLLLAEENVTALEKLVDLADDRLTELNRRVKVGKTRRADSLGQEVLLNSLRSQLEESVRQRSARRDLLAFLIGQRQLDSVVQDTMKFSAPMTLDSYLATTTERPDIQAARESTESFKHLMEVTRADFLPSFGASATRYTDKSVNSDEADWDAVITMDLPLWDWNSRGSAMDAAGANVSQSQKTYEQSLRQAELDVRNAYRDLLSAEKQRAIREASVNYAREDYQMQVDDDSKGLVTSLEVFESLDRLNTAELAYNSAKLQEKLAVITLHIAAGSDAEDILS